MKLIKLSSDHYIIVDDSEKVIYTTQEIENTVVPIISLSEVKELLGEVDVERKAEETYRRFPSTPKEHSDWGYGEDVNVHRKRKAFIKGYNQALEDNKDRIKNILMEYDLMVKKHLLMYSIEHSIHGKICEGLSVVRNEYIQSLQPPTSWDVTIVDGKFKLV